VIELASLKIHPKYFVLPAAVFAAALALHGGMYEGPMVRASAHVAALAILIYAIFAWTARWRVVRAVIGLLIAGEILVRVAYGSSISIIVIMSVVNTNPYLTSSFLLEYAAECLLLVLFILAVTWAPVPKQTKLTLAATVLGISYLVVPMFEGSEGVFASDVFKGHRQTARARGFSDTYARFDYAISHMSRRFPPLNWVVAIPDTVQFARLAEDSESSWSDVSVSEYSPRLLVLGIGESLRANNLSLYGYSRETTPALVRRSSDLYIYNRAYAGGTNSWNALPAMLTLFQGRPDFSKSIMYLADDAGYKTYWLSNHPKYSAYDFSISAIADQANHVYFAADEFGDGSYDEVLVPKLEKILRDAADDDDRHLIVVHFMGSHLRFHERYPESFSRFTGGAKDLDRYDNSVLYSDFVQDQVLDLVQQYGAEYLFFADHGLGHPEGEYPLKHDVRETPAVDSLHVPFFATSEEALRFDADDTVSLFFFECVFARWAGISARALQERDYCDSSLNQNDVTFLDSNVQINTQGVFN
jgi:glucan phosphoethanolaminetransferase (alkaline phosphatase superfamily)